MHGSAPQANEPKAESDKSDDFEGIEGIEGGADAESALEVIYGSSRELQKHSQCFTISSAEPRLDDAQDGGLTDNSLSRHYSQTLYHFYFLSKRERKAESGE